LVQGQNFLTHEQLNPTQLAALASTPEAAEEDDDTEENED